MQRGQSLNAVFAVFCCLAVYLFMCVLLVEANLDENSFYLCVLGGIWLQC